MVDSQVITELTEIISRCNNAIGLIVDQNAALSVTGAGTAAANGTYTPRGYHQCKPFYNLDSQPTNPFNASIFWSGGGWVLTSLTGDLNLYIAEDNTERPVGATFEIQDGDDPPPAISEL